MRLPLGRGGVGPVTLLFLLSLVSAPCWSTRLQDDALARIGGAPQRVDLQPSLLAQLARSLQRADADVLSDFAHSALQEMVDSYAVELDDVRIVVASGGGRRHRSWSAATSAYMLRLTSFQEAVEAGAPVTLEITAAETVQLWIASEPVIVQGPRLANASEFERRIVESFCVLHQCPEPSPRAPLKSERLALPAQGIWSFSDSKGHAFETGAGLRFVFQDLSERRRKQQLCLRLSEELALLAAGLQSTRSKGFAIDWESLEILSLGKGYPNRVRLNRRGDYFELRLPNLGRLPSLWKQAKPWLQAQVAREPAEYFFADADRLLDPLLH